MLKREISALKEKLMETGKEPKKKKLKLSEVCDEIRKESYYTWYYRRTSEQKRIEKITEEENILIEKEKEKRK